MNKSVLIITKSFIEKNLSKQRIPCNSINKILYDWENLSLGIQIQDVAKNYFKNVNVLSLSDLFLLMKEPVQLDIDNYDYIITVGGDGTFLSTAHFV